MGNFISETVKRNSNPSQTRIVGPGGTAGKIWEGTRKEASNPYAAITNTINSLGQGNIPDAGFSDYLKGRTKSRNKPKKPIGTGAGPDEMTEEEADLDRLGPKYDVAAPTWDTQNISAQNFDPYRRQQMNAADSASQSQQAGMIDEMQRTGGMSSADAMNFANKMNRSKIEGQQGALAGVNAQEAQNQFQVGSANVQAQNTSAQNLAMQDYQNKNTAYDASRDRWKMGKALDAGEKLADFNERQASKRPSFISDPFRDLRPS